MAFLGRVAIREALAISTAFRLTVLRTRLNRFALRCWTLWGRAAPYTPSDGAYAIAELARGDFYTNRSSLILSLRLIAPKIAVQFDFVRQAVRAN